VDRRDMREKIAVLLSMLTHQPAPILNNIIPDKPKAA
jgi:hypothetical protein